MQWFKVVGAAFIAALVVLPRFGNAQSSDSFQQRWMKVGINATPTNQQLAVGGISGNNIAKFTYGTPGAPFPTHPQFGYVGLDTTIYVSPGAGTSDAISAAINGRTHLSAGSRGVAVGGLFQTFNDGTWTKGVGFEAGSVAVFTSASTARAGTIFGLGAHATASATPGAIVRGGEFDVAASAAPDDKMGLIVVSNSNDTVQATGVSTVDNGLGGAGNAYLKSAAYQMVAVSGGVGFKYGILSIKDAASQGQVITTNGAWSRLGGFTLDTGLDWRDANFTGYIIRANTFNVTGAGAVTTGSWNASAIDIAHGGTGVTSKAAAFDALSPMTELGDMIYASASGKAARLAAAPEGSVLSSAGIDQPPSWSSAPTIGRTLNVGSTRAPNATLESSGEFRVSGNGGRIPSGAGAFIGYSREAGGRLTVLDYSVGYMPWSQHASIHTFHTKGSSTPSMVVAAGVQVGVPEGGDKGVGTINIAKGIFVDNRPGLSATKTVRNAAGTGTCTLVFTKGLLTGGTC